MKRPKSKNLRAQVGALPVRQGADGLEVLLITSRETQRWIVPKGWPMKGRRDHDAAAREALEEAGVTGRIGTQPIGAFTYEKRLRGYALPCRVMVYRLDVDRELEVWRENKERLRQWFCWSDAAATVSEPALATLIRRIADECHGSGDQGESDAKAQ